MQKIMFNDRYHHTNAVIEGRKTRATQIMAGIDFPVNMVMGRVLPDKDGKIYAVANGGEYHREIALQGQRGRGRGAVLLQCVFVKM